MFDIITFVSIVTKIGNNNFGGSVRFWPELLTARAMLEFVRVRRLLELVTSRPLLELVRPWHYQN